MSNIVISSLRKHLHKLDIKIHAYTSSVAQRSSATSPAAPPPSGAGANSDAAAYGASGGSSGAVPGALQQASGDNMSEGTRKRGVDGQIRHVSCEGGVSAHEAFLFSP